MAVYNSNGALKYKDEAGDLYILRPVTGTECVEGLSDLLDNKSEIDHTHTAADIGADESGAATQALTDAMEYADGKIAYSTSDLTAGTSALTTGKLYVVYE